MMKPEEIEAFARQLIDGCETHDAWLSVVRFGLPTLLENQPILIEIIVKEAIRVTDPTVNEVRRILDELHLRLEVSD